MKKFFEKHTVAKLVGILFFIAIVLSWIIPYSAFQGAELMKTEKANVGLSDITTIFSTSISFIIDKIVYLVALGGFYAVISKTNGYKKIVSGIVKKLKGKEVLSTIIVSIVIAILSSFMTQSFVVILFIPFFITILRNLGMNKITTFAATFGAMLVGILGATYGYEGLITFDAYFSQTLSNSSAMKMTLGYRSIILLIALALYNFFIYFAAKKSIASKSKKEKIEDEYLIEEVKGKGIKTFPMIIILVIALLFAILGYIDWAGTFKLNIFNDFHNWLTGLKVGKDFTIMSYILGRDVTAFGTWNLYNISFVLVFLSALTALLYSIKFDDFFTAFGEGVKRLLKPMGVLIAVYAIFVATYMTGITPKIADDIMHVKAVPEYNIDYNGSQVAFFNIDVDDDKKADTNLINQDVDKDGKCDFNCDTNKDGYPDEKLDFDGNGKIDATDESIEKQLQGGVSTLNQDVDGDGVADINVSDNFNLVKLTIGSVIVDIFNNDLGYSGYSMSGYLLANYGATQTKLVFLVFVTIFGLLQFFIPSSIILTFGLTYSDVSICDWYKYAWRFILGMLCIILLIFIFILII